MPLIRRRLASLSDLMKHRALFVLSCRCRSVTMKQYDGTQSPETKESKNIPSSTSAFQMPLVSPSEAISGSDTPLFTVSNTHFVTHNNMYGPFSRYYQQAIFGMGCFWSSEYAFLNDPELLKGIYSTQVGYCAGFTKNPTYEQVCSHLTGHIEVVRIVYDANVVKYSELLEAFWTRHNPCQGMRQGDNYGTQYRSAILFTTDSQKYKALQSKQEYERVLKKNPETREYCVTTEIIDASDIEFYYAEDDHQQSFFKSPEKSNQCTMVGLAIANAARAMEQNAGTEPQYGDAWKTMNDEMYGEAVSVNSALGKDPTKRYEASPSYETLESLYYGDFQQ